ncbi:MAG: amidohydrolase family protein [Candidatus Schekmanbacteria bacterium]|nr:amidohydrolase family protein [Candidatus Schekmanbacteria bacterium]
MDPGEVTLLVHGGTVVTSWRCPEVIAGGAVGIAGARVAVVGSSAELRAAHPGARHLDAHGGLIVPGLINAHHHFYSALARGLNPGYRTATFVDILDKLWWRLDRALDLDAVRVSAELSLLACIKAGCTAFFDHHASPGCISGSLEVIGEAALRAGLRGVLAYEVTDRNGRAGARLGIAENQRFIQACRGQQRLRGVMGLHASFTLSDETLAEVAAALAALDPADGGCHVHVAEDRADVSESRAALGGDPVARLDRFGMLGPRALLAHGVHLDAVALSRVAESGAVLVHNPESNANNAVGWLDLKRARAAGATICLGTDGMSSAPLRSLRFSFLADRLQRADATAGFEVHPELLANNAAVARRFFDDDRLGELTVGAPADVAVIDAPPPTPMAPDNFFGHLIYGAADAAMRHTIASGKVLMENGDVLSLDARAIVENARRLAPGLWARFADTAPGTPFRVL